jgi:hypothetical protein
MLKDKDTVEMEVALVKKIIDDETKDIFKELISSHRSYQKVVKDKDDEIKRLTNELVDAKLLIQKIKSLL